MPSLLSFFTIERPLVFIGTTISDLFLCAWPSPVLASRHIQSACAPLVVHILPPSITQSPPTRRAVVLIEATSEPAESRAGERGREELLAQLVAAVAGERWRRHRDLHTGAHRDRAAVHQPERF